MVLSHGNAAVEGGFLSTKVAGHIILEETIDAIQNAGMDWKSAT